MTTAKKKVTVGKIKVLTNHVKNLYRAVDNYYQKGFYLEKKLYIKLTYKASFSKQPL